MPNVQDPIVPKAPENPFAPYLSAFVAFANVANKRRALEEQLTKLELQNQLGNARLDIMQQNANTAQERLGLYADRVKKAADQDHGDMDRVIEAQDKVFKLGQQFRPGTDDYEAGLLNLQDQYSDIALGTKEGKALFDSAEKRHNLAAKSGVQASVQNARDFRSWANGMGIPERSFDMDGIMWGKNKDGSRYLDYELNAQGQRVRPIPPNSREEGKKYDSITIDGARWETRKNQYETLDDPNNRPSAKATTRPQSLRDRAQSAIDDPDATPAEKAAAQKILGSQ